MAAFVLRKNDDLFVQRNIPKNEIGELPDDEVSCDCINVTKLIKTNFSLNLYCIIIFYELLPLNFQKTITKHI